MGDVKELTAASIVCEAAEDTKFWNEPSCPFLYHIFPGATRLAVIVGENASGKSLLFRFAAQIARTDHKLTAFTISIRERTGAGHQEMSRMMRAFMFGDEQEQSTGATSYNVVKAGFHNAGRDDLQSAGSLLMLDEPEIGLSDSYTRALGEYIGTSTKELPDTCKGVVLVTHNRELVKGLRHGFGEWPTFINMSGHVAGVDWLAHPEHRSVKDLADLPGLGGFRRKETARLLRKPGTLADEEDVK